MKAFKVFIKPSEVPQRSVKIKILLNFFLFVRDWVNMKDEMEWVSEWIRTNLVQIIKSFCNLIGSLSSKHQPDCLAHSCPLYLAMEFCSKIDARHSIISQHMLWRPVMIHQKKCYKIWNFLYIILFLHNYKKFVIRFS